MPETLVYALLVGCCISIILLGVLLKVHAHDMKLLTGRLDSLVGQLSKVQSELQATQAEGIALVADSVHALGTSNERGFISLQERASQDAKAINEGITRASASVIDLKKSLDEAVKL